ncbi:MAG: glucose 1-dehydrogenase [Chloroflexota bacterium]
MIDAPFGLDSTMHELHNRVALVTGAGRGVGQAIAMALSRHGAAVAVSARSQNQIAATANAIEQAGGRALAVPADVTNERDVAHLVEQTEKHLGPIDLLVSNAGVAGVFGPIWEVDAAAWWRTIEVNLEGVFLCAREVLRGMVERRRGRIINVASGLGTFATPYGSAYGTSKAAVLHLTNSLAAETAEFGISVFAISPGRVHTQMADEIERDEARRKWLPEPSSQPWSPPERAAGLVVFLAGGHADRLSGRYIHVSTDLTAMMDRAEEIERDDLYTLRLREIK